jgi:hypothetical protein
MRRKIANVLRAIADYIDTPLSPIYNSSSSIVTFFDSYGRPIKKDGPPWIRYDSATAHPVDELIDWPSWNENRRD